MVLWCYSMLYCYFISSLFYVHHRAGTAQASRTDGSISVVGEHISILVIGEHISILVIGEHI